MKKILFLVVLLLMTACNEKVEEQKSQNVESEMNKHETVNGSVELKEKDLLRQLGLELNGEKITIDMNQTDHFIKQMEIKMQGRAEEIEKKIEQADINFTQGFGIEIEGNKIAFDLNKTKDMLQQINILMKDILLDVNRSVH